VGHTVYVTVAIYTRPVARPMNTVVQWLTVMAYTYIR